MILRGFRCLQINRRKAKEGGGLLKPIILASLLFITSCAIEEVKTENNIHNVAVVFTKQDENSFIIKKELEEMFGLQNSPKYKILALKKEEVTTSGFGSDAFTSNFLLTITVSYRVIDVDSGKVIFSGSEIGSTNYISSRQNVVAEFTSKKAAGQNVSEALAKKVFTAIQSHFNLQQLNEDAP